MTELHPKFITNYNGTKLSVVLPIQEFDAILEELELQEDLRLYDQAKKEDSGERILLADYLKKRGQANA